MAFKLKILQNLIINNEGLDFYLQHRQEKYFSIVQHLAKKKDEVGLKQNIINHFSFSFFFCLLFFSFLFSLLGKKDRPMWSYLLPTVITNNPDFKSNTSSLGSQGNLLIIKKLNCTRIITKEAKIMNLIIMIVMSNKLLVFSSISPLKEKQSYKTAKQCQKYVKSLY